MSIEFELLATLVEGRNGHCAVTGNFENGYLKLRVGGSYVEVGPDESPDDQPMERSFFAIPVSRAITFFAKPAWKSGDFVVVECYELSGNLVDQAHKVVV